jgi:phenylpyruvate tautomerase
MPLLKLETTGAVPERIRESLLKALSTTVAETLGKPEQYVMVSLTSTEILMSGASGPAAFVDLRSIGGLTREVNRKLTERIGKVLQSFLGIGADRVYVTFMDINAGNWGWNGATFG